MGKPAARLGDMTAHGGSITMGAPTVLIGGQPAARVGDMHVCPFVQPAVPPIPHVGGPIMPPGAVTVLICGQPAACVGDMCTCTGPPATILPPGCPTVLIGPGGGGGGGGGGGAAQAGQAGEGEGGAGDASAALEEGEEPEDHYLDVKFVDKGGFPVTGAQYVLNGPGGKSEQGPLAGRIRKTGVESGSYEIELRAIYDARWSVEEAAVGDSVTLSAQTTGLEGGSPAKVTVYMRDYNEPDKPFQELTGEVQGDKIEVDWSFEVDENLLSKQENKEKRGGYSRPVYFFVVEALGCRARSGLLRYKDRIALRLKDEEGNPIGNASYRLRLPTGEIREGTLDGDGHAQEENLPPGRVRISYNARGR